MLKALRYSKMLLLLLILFIYCSNETVAQSISVVVSKSSKNVPSQSDIKKIFTAKKLNWSGGNTIQVVDQAKTDTGNNFYNKFINVNPNRVLVDWTKLVLSGQATAPTKCNDDAAVKKEVASNPDTIGYILSSSLDDSVIEVAKLEF